MVVGEMLLWLEVLSIRFPVQLMGSLFPISHGITYQYHVKRIEENSSKQVNVGATFVLQETFMGHQTTSHSACLLVSLNYLVVPVYLM